jgi:hypothetical protein
MDESRAREILGKDWSLIGDGVEPNGTMHVSGIFTADELEAIAWWMRNKTKENEV